MLNNLHIFPNLSNHSPSFTAVIPEFEPHLPNTIVVGPLLGWHGVNEANLPGSRVFGWKSRESVGSVDSKHSKRAQKSELQTFHVALPTGRP